MMRHGICIASDMEAENISAVLSRWKNLLSVGKKPSTLRFHAEIAATVIKHWPQDVPPVQATEDALSEFALRVGHYAPSRWNLMVSAVRYATGRHVFKYRRLRFRHFTPPTQQQFINLLAECDRAPRSHCGLIVRFLALTGLRINEARQLKWCDVTTDCIQVPGAITKNSLPRCIPLLPGACEVLKRLKIVSAEKVIPHASIKTALRKACHRAGLPPLSHHCLRHYFSTVVIMSGVDPITLAKWLGHSDGGTLVGRLYFHLLDDHSRRMASKVVIAI